VGEDLENVDGVRDVLSEGWVNGQLKTEVAPYLPRAVVGHSSTRYDAVSARKLCSAQVTEEIILCRGVCKCQG
jgi:hypothetical protein